VTASEVWWLVAAIVAGLAALLHLASAAPPRRTTAPATGEHVVARVEVPLAAIARALTAAAVGLIALALLVLP
jgi:hypothetical protein